MHLPGGIFLVKELFMILFFHVTRTDGGQHNLRSAAYEALMEMVKNSPKDCYVTVQKTTMVILERLQKVIQMEVYFYRLLTIEKGKLNLNAHDENGSL